MGNHENLAGAFFVVGGLPLLVAIVIEKYKKNYTSDAIVASTALVSAAIFYALGWSVLFVIAVCLMFGGGLRYLKEVIADKRRGSRYVYSGD